jgi:hypothetical protein
MAAYKKACLFFHKIVVYIQFLEKILANEKKNGRNPRCDCDWGKKGNKSLN